MNAIHRVLRALLLCALLANLAGCAGTTPDPTDANYLPDPAPSREDSSHGWGTAITQ